MSLNMVVVAAIALIVLVVLTAIFAGKLRTSTESGEKSTDETINKVCSRNGGYCVSTRSECTTGTPKEGQYIDCSKVCCVQ